MPDFIYYSLTLMLETLDIEGTIAFYTGVLDFRVKDYVEGMGWVSLQRGRVSIMFSAPNEHRNVTVPVMSGSLYIRTSGVDEVWKQLKDRCNICYPIENFEYGMREFAIFDNNGYLLQFGQKIEVVP
jgi:uncharacterized glyoxalase superfamily protein PhnB